MFYRFVFGMWGDVGERDRGGNGIGKGWHGGRERGDLLVRSETCFAGPSGHDRYAHCHSRICCLCMYVCVKGGLVSTRGHILERGVELMNKCAVGSRRRGT